MNLQIPTRTVSGTANGSRYINLSGTWQAHTSTSTSTTTSSVSVPASNRWGGDSWGTTLSPPTGSTYTSASITSSLPSGVTGSATVQSNGSVSVRVSATGVLVTAFTLSVRLGVSTTTTDYWYANDSYWLGSSSYDYSSFSLVSGTRPTLSGSNGYVYANWTTYSQPSGTTVTCAGYANYTYPTTYTYANVYFNGTRVNYVYFNGTRYP